MHNKGYNTHIENQNNGYNLPDFIIVGAMKSGTTSIHYILNQSDEIFIPDGEVFFFDIDDILRHPDFFVKTSNGWTFHDYDKNFEEYLNWYKSLFKDADDTHIIGEDSTTYMVSEKAPSRIANLLPNVKLIFMLRDPVSRTYSHYQHLVQSGRAIYDFDKTIQYMPNYFDLIQRSFYKIQIERFFKHFSEKNMKFVLFEEFLEDTQKVINDICDFLGANHINLEKIDTHKNASKVPRSIKLQLIYNQITRGITGKTYLNSHLPYMESSESFNEIIKYVDKGFKEITFTKNKKYPKMEPSTKKFLQELFAKENKGISEIIDKDVQKYWSYIDK